MHGQPHVRFIFVRYTSSVLLSSSSQSSEMAYKVFWATEVSRHSLLGRSNCLPSPS